MNLRPKITVNIGRARVQKRLKLLGSEIYSHELVVPAPDFTNEANFIFYICSLYLKRSEVNTLRIRYASCQFILSSKSLNILVYKLYSKMFTLRLIRMIVPKYNKFYRKQSTV